MIHDIDAFDAALRTDFASFLQRTFRELEPGGELSPGWHLDAIAWKLDQVRQDPGTSHALYCTRFGWRHALLLISSRSFYSFGVRSFVWGVFVDRSLTLWNREDSE